MKRQPVLYYLLQYKILKIFIQFKTSMSLTKSSIKNTNKECIYSKQKVCVYVTTEMVSFKKALVLMNFQISLRQTIDQKIGNKIVQNLSL